MEEAVEPFVSEMKRYLELGLEEQAREVCQGILLGLYRAQDGEENDVLNWAPDFPAESAGNALDIWMSASVAKDAPANRKRRRLSSGFLRKHIPKWVWAFKASGEDR